MYEAQTSKHQFAAKLHVRVPDTLHGRNPFPCSRVPRSKNVVHPPCIVRVKSGMPMESTSRIERASLEASYPSPSHSFSLPRLFVHLLSSRIPSQIENRLLDEELVNSLASIPEWVSHSCRAGFFVYTKTIGNYLSKSRDIQGKSPRVYTRKFAARA